MTKRFGALVGTNYDPANASPKPTSSAHERGTDHVLRRDRIELAAAPVDDVISLGKFNSNTVLDPDRCMAWFDDLGATTTMNIGHEAGTGYAADDNSLVDAQDVNAAAGSFSLLKGVNIDKYFLPLWQMLGLAADPGGKIELIATIKGSAATGTFSWQIMGQDR